MAATKSQECVIPRQFEAQQCHTSFINVAQTKNINRVEHPDTSEGRKYGYIAQNLPRKISGHCSCGFANAPPYSGLQGVVSLGMSLHPSICPNARDGSPNAKNDWHNGKNLSHIGMVGDITNHALHHSDVAIEHASDTPTGPSLSAESWMIGYFAYLMMSIPNVRDKPKAKLDALRPSRPSKMTGRRPMKSDKRLHCQVVSACVTKKRDSYAKVNMAGSL